MISEILPQGVEAVDQLGDDPTAELLAPEEAALGDVCEGRRREFTTARSCARRALNKLGLPSSPILRGPKREPLWPQGVVGSITHCFGYRAAAVARQEDFISIGIDAEVHADLPSGISERILLREEQAWLRSVRGMNVCWDRVLFSAKESIYKAWFPLTGKWLGFEDALVRIDPARGSFHAHLLTTDLFFNGRKLDCLEGRFCIREQVVLTFVSIPTRAECSL